LHPEYPLERTCSHLSEPLQLSFARRAMEILPQREDGSAEATHQGLVLRAETETAFEIPIEVLKEVYGDQVRIGSPTVRYHRSPQLEEPHMGVRVMCGNPHFAAVKADLLSRGARILDAEVTAQFGVVRATAPLVRLLGYAQALLELTAGSAREVMWLSHYAPVDIPPPSGQAA
jgi:translation elongation factor EF-G